MVNSINTSSSFPLLFLPDDLFFTVCQQADSKDLASLIRVNTTIHALFEKNWKTLWQFLSQNHLGTYPQDSWKSISQFYSIQHRIENKIYVGFNGTHNLDQKTFTPLIEGRAKGQVSNPWGAQFVIPFNGVKIYLHTTGDRNRSFGTHSIFQGEECVSTLSAKEIPLDIVFVDKTQTHVFTVYEAGRNIEIWDVKTGKLEQSFPLTDPSFLGAINGIRSIVEIDEQFYVGCLDGVKILAKKPDQTGNLKWTVEKLEESCNGITYLHLSCGLLFCASAQEHKVQIFDLKQKQWIKTIFLDSSVVLPDYGSLITSLAFGYEKLFVGFNDHTIVGIDVNTEERVFSFGRSCEKHNFCPLMHSPFIKFENGKLEIDINEKSKEYSCSYDFTKASIFLKA